MPLEIGTWPVDGSIRRMAAAVMPLEARLEDLVESGPASLGEPPWFVGRQLPACRLRNRFALDGLDHRFGLDG